MVSSRIFGEDPQFRRDIKGTNMKQRAEDSVEMDGVETVPLTTFELLLD